MSDRDRIVATYARVSSEEQRERRSITNQRLRLDQWVSATPRLRCYRGYEDDGVSGTVAFEERPAGRQLLEDARAGHFREVVVVRTDRISRDSFEAQRIWRELDRLGLVLVATDESIEDKFIYDIMSAVADQDRRKLLARSAEGMARAAREGRYTGGIVPFGYTVEGTRHNARLVPSDRVVWQGLTEADIVDRMYQALAIEDKSCRQIADELNALGVLTVYARDGRGVRGKRTQGQWRSGRIRNLVVNPVYKGVLQYGRRTTNAGREVIEAKIEPLVSAEMWQAAQDTLERNRLIPKNSRRVHLLRSRIKCGQCGLNYTGSRSRSETWYRCNGQLTERGPIEGRCPAKAVKGSVIEEVVWHDIEQLLRAPGDLIDALAAEMVDASDDRSAGLEERSGIEAALGELDTRRERVVDVYARGLIAESDLDKQTTTLEGQRTVLLTRLEELGSPPPLPEPIPDAIRHQLADRLGAGLTAEERQEIVRLLVHQITIHTVVAENGSKSARAIVEYRMPDPAVVATCTETDSSRRSASAGRAYPRCRPRV